MVGSAMTLCFYFFLFPAATNKKEAIKQTTRVPLDLKIIALAYSRYYFFVFFRVPF